MENRVALVTGANRGIGKEVANQLAHEYGLQVLLGSRDLAKGEAAAAEIGGGAVAIELDVSNEVSIQTAFQIIEHKFGRLDVLVNNAGVDYDTDQKAHSADLARVRRTFDTNLFGHGLPLLRRRHFCAVVIRGGL